MGRPRRAFSHRVSFGIFQLPLCVADIPFHSIVNPGKRWIKGLGVNVTTEIVKQGGILEWPQVLQDLVAMVASESGQVSSETQEGAIGALFKICEDNRQALDQEYQTHRPLAFLLPKLVEFSQHSNPKVRAKKSRHQQGSAS